MKNINSFLAMMGLVAASVNTDQRFGTTRSRYENANSLDEREKAAASKMYCPSIMITFCVNGVNILATNKKMAKKKFALRTN